MRIEDGKGSGKFAAVDWRNRIETHTVSMTAGEQATSDGESFNVNTGWITLTSANETPILYLKNNDLIKIHISAIAVGLSPSTGGSSSEIPSISVVKNPTGGTIVSSAVAAPIVSNRNFGSVNQLDADVYIGGTGYSMTGASDHLIIAQASNGRVFATIDEVIPQNKSIGILITPQSGTTSQKVYAALILNIER